MKPILITGAHRSGTTWVGHILRKATRVRYIHEPFNVGMINPQSPFGKWFQHVTETSYPGLLRKTLKYISLYYSPPPKHLVKNLAVSKRLRSNYKEVKDYLHRFNHRPLIKDPIALMSAPWLYQQLNCDVVIIIRHPAAFVDSIITHNWTHSFDHFLEQKHLMQTYLVDYKTIISVPLNNTVDFGQNH